MEKNTAYYESDAECELVPDGVEKNPRLSFYDTYSHHIDPDEWIEINSVYFTK